MGEMTGGYIPNFIATDYGSIKGGMILKVYCWQSALYLAIHGHVFGFPNKFSYVTRLNVSDYFANHAVAGSGVTWPITKINIKAQLLKCSH